MRERLAHARNALRPSEENLLSRSLTFNVLGRGISLALGFVGSIALARLLGPADRGLLALMLSLSGIAVAVGAVGQPAAVTYFSSRKDADQRAILGNTTVHAAVLAAILVPFTLLLHEQIADAFGRGNGGLTWVLAAALAPVTFLGWTAGNQLVGMLRFGLFNALTIAAVVAETIAIFVLIWGFGLGVAGGIIAMGISSLVTIAGSLRPILGSLRPRLDRALERRMLHYGWRVQVGVIFQAVNYRLDVIIMQLFRPLSQVGYYVVAQTIAELVITLATAFQSSVLPLSSHYEGDARRSRVTVGALHHHAILAGAAVLANAVFGSALILFLYGPEFHPAIVPMLVLLPGIWFLGLGLVIQSDLAGRGRPGLSSAMAALAAGATVILDFALIPPFGVIGAAVASVAAYTFFGIASLIALSRVSGIGARELVVPTREDFMAYRSFIARLVGRRRVSSPAVNDQGGT
ncbi:MAG: oligosaccharide flippase family protein [Solirubrobacteraceae bacterium]